MITFTYPKGNLINNYTDEDLSSLLMSIWNAVEDNRDLSIAMSNGDIQYLYEQKVIDEHALKFVQNYYILYGI
jgi:hypothetical protein